MISVGAVVVVIGVVVVVVVVVLAAAVVAAAVFVLLPCCLCFGCAGFGDDFIRVLLVTLFGVFSASAAAHVAYSCPMLSIQARAVSDSVSPRFRPSLSTTSID